MCLPTHQMLIRYFIHASVSWQALQTVVWYWPKVTSPETVTVKLWLCTKEPTQSRAWPSARCRRPHTCLLLLLTEFMWVWLLWRTWTCLWFLDTLLDFWPWILCILSATPCPPRTILKYSWTHTAVPCIAHPCPIPLRIPSLLWRVTNASTCISLTNEGRALLLMDRSCWSTGTVDICF